jgi:hypothetical protein
MCDWSHSNMQRLWQVGYDAGNRFVDKFKDRLPDRAKDGAYPA